MKSEAEAIKAASQRGPAETFTLSVLQISDLHRDPANPVDNTVLLDSLERDRDRYTSDEEAPIAPPSLILVCGDIVQGVRHGVSDAEAKLQDQYQEASDFLHELASRFVNGDKQRVVLVPGNHDVNDTTFRRSLQRVDIKPGRASELVAQLFAPDTSLRWSWDDLAFYRVHDGATYRARLRAFADFYASFYGDRRSYPVTPESQFDVFEYPELDLSIVGFSSCHDNDLLNRQGSIHPLAIAKASDKLRQLSFSYASPPVRIAVWHHSIEGPPMESDFMNPEVVQNLIDSGYSLGLHGHRHRPQLLHTRFHHGPKRRITVVGAGTLCGGSASRFGRSYNVIEIDVPRQRARLHVREMQNNDVRMPIWASHILSPDRMRWVDFSFDPPPQPMVSSQYNTVALTTAQERYDAGDYERAAAILERIANVDPLARRLLLQCLRELDDPARIIASFIPPRSPEEAIVVMDALWSSGDKSRLANILNTSFVSESRDPSVIEMRSKYSARLSHG